MAKTFSTGHGGSRIRTYRDLFRSYQQDNQGMAARYYCKFCDVKTVIESQLERDISDVDILEIGSGQRFTFTLLFGAFGARAVGIDTDYVPRRIGVKEFLAIRRSNGTERAIKTMARKALFDRAYYQALEESAGRTLPLAGVDLRTMDACALDFSDQTFDCIFSTSVFEHIHDIDAAAREAARVLRPGGLALIDVCVFCGISGGHHPEWSHPDQQDVPRQVPAWDHLRQNLFPASTYLNRKRTGDYLATFQEHFSVVQMQPRYQGRRYLTDEIIQELQEYTPDELLTDSVRILARR
jgi:SAM-dependent methyltransferase